MAGQQGPDYDQHKRTSQFVYLCQRPLQKGQGSQPIIHINIYIYTNRKEKPIGFSFLLVYILCLGDLFSGQPLKPFKWGLSVGKNSIVRHRRTFFGLQ